MNRLPATMAMAIAILCTLWPYQLFDSVAVAAFHIQPQTGLPGIQWRARCAIIFSAAVVLQDDDKSELSRFSSLEQLESSYPLGIPAGMRGEAVRSALRSNKCIVYTLSGSPFELGMIKVEGRGCVPFLNSKLTQSFERANNSERTRSISFQSACLLNAKGRVIDTIAVAMIPSTASSSPSTLTEESTLTEAMPIAESALETSCAFLLTSPGHTSDALFQRLDPFIFPMDQIKLSRCCCDSDAGFVFTLAAVHRSSIQETFHRLIKPHLSHYHDKNNDDRIELPATAHEATFVSSLRTTSDSKDESVSLLIVPCTYLPECAVTGFTLYFFGREDDASGRRVGKEIWQYLLDDPTGPIHVGPLEFHTLRIESGQPAFGFEMTAGMDMNTSLVASANPLELHLEPIIDLDKGCYLGQEGVASIVKSRRGPPRLLYQVIFHNEYNDHDENRHGNDNDDDEYFDNDDSLAKDNNHCTRVPQPGDKLYVLGSNQDILVGTLTSVAEPVGNGESLTIGLALVRRADSILKQMKASELEIPTYPPSHTNENDKETKTFGHNRTLMPLEGLEVIVGDTYIVGRLQTVPWKRSRSGENMFVDSTWIQDDSEELSEQSNKVKRHDQEAFYRTDTVATGRDESIAPGRVNATSDAESERKLEKIELLR